jgi:hypothetical protein
VSNVPTTAAAHCMLCGAIQCASSEASLGVAV